MNPLIPWLTAYPKCQHAMRYVEPILKAARRLGIHLDALQLMHHDGVKGAHIRAVQVEVRALNG